MQLEVSIGQGRLRGSDAGDGVVAFRGIPYAAAPFGPHRFREPAPPPSWDGVREATSFGPTAPKAPYPPPADVLLPEPVVPGEECLNLNVWTPDPGGAGLPVMVWVHGGSFVNGSGAVPVYDGTRFARDGVVLVTINYRLGVEGFALLEGVPPNRGLLDQVAALTWVQENIAAFGGDPAAVTVFGESAGGMSVGSLLSMPRARGLFRRAAAQSGAGHHVLTAPTATRVTGYLAERLGVEPTAEGLAGLPVADVVAAQGALALESRQSPDPQRWGEVATNLMLFEPVADGDVLPALPVAGVRGGAGGDVDLLVGSNSDEHRFFLTPTGVMDMADEAALRRAAAGYGLDVDRALEVYRAARPDGSPGELLVDVATDWFFRIPALRLAEARTGPAASYVYEFAWPSPQVGGRLGACHALEIGFVFDTLDAEAGRAMVGDAPPQPLADVMHKAWVDFAATGDPGWPAYDTQRRAVMRFDTTSQVVEDPGAATRALWDGIR